MESPGVGPDVVTSGIKRRVKDKRATKTTLNVSLASKIKTKIIKTSTLTALGKNHSGDGSGGPWWQLVTRPEASQSPQKARYGDNSSIFKISLKHNNRALAQALSREKENARRIATEKMLLQKEVEKLNFENTFLRLKLDNLNKKLIEIESLLSINLLTAIEMSSLSEFHQSSFLPSNSKKKQPSKQCELIRLPFARVLLSSNDEEDDKEKMPWDRSVTSKVSPDAPSSVSVIRSAPTPYNADTVFLKENNWSVCGPDDSEHISSSASLLAKEGHSHLGRSPQPPVVDKTTSAPWANGGPQTLSLGNVTERRRRASWVAGRPAAGAPCEEDALGLGWCVETTGCANEKTVTVPRNVQGLPGPENPPVPSRRPGTDGVGHAPDGGDPQGQTTLYGADMELTATDVGTIVTVCRGGGRRSGRKTSDGELKASRSVRDGSSETRRERPKRKRKMSAGTAAEVKAAREREGARAPPGGEGDSEDPGFPLRAAQLPPADPLGKTTLQRSSGGEGGYRARCSGEEEETRAASTQEEVQEAGRPMRRNSLLCSKSKASRQTFVIHRLEKDRLGPNQEDNETTSRHVEDAHEFQTADLSSKESQNSYDSETQNMLKLKPYVTDSQPAQQNQSEVNKLKQKVNRKTQIIFQVNQRYEGNGKDVHAPHQRSISFQAQGDKETISENLGASEDFGLPVPFGRDRGNLCDRDTQNIPDSQKQVTVLYPVQQNESKINKKLRQKVNRKTEIISEVNHFDDGKSWRCSEKGDSLSLQKEKETLPGDTEGLSEFQTSVLPAQNTGKPHDDQTQNVAAAVSKRVHGVQAACQSDSETGEPRERGNRDTETIPGPPLRSVSRGRGLLALGKDNFVSLTQKDEEAVSENPRVTHKFQTDDLPTKDHRNLCDYENQKSCVTSVQLLQQNEPKTNKKLRQKVNRKTEVISKIIQTYEDIDNDVHDQKSYSENLDIKINKSKPRLDCQRLLSEYYMEINSNEKKDCNQIPDPSKLAKKHRQTSGKARRVLTRDQNELALASAAGAQAPASPESGLTPFGGGQDCAARRPRSATPVAEGHVSWVEVRAGQCQATEAPVTTPRATPGKTPTALPLGSPEAVPATPCAGRRRTVDINPDSQTLSRIYSPNTQGFSSAGVREGSMPVNVFSSKVLIIEDHSAPQRAPVHQVCGDGYRKTKELRASVGGRAQKPGPGDRTLRDLTNTSFFSSNTVQPESESGDEPSKPPGRKRRCAPLSLKEPSLRRKMRR